MYAVTITNLTAKQVFSPPLVATHANSMHVWQVGGMASPGVRIVAEDGAHEALADELRGKVTDLQALGMQGKVKPGESVTVNISARPNDVLSVAFMLVQTNDGFTGLDNLPLTNSRVVSEIPVYDAGTEENTEKASDVPGPPFMGMQRAPTTPQQPIQSHPGLTNQGDIGPEFNWTNPAARIIVSPMPSVMPDTGVANAALPRLVALVGALALVAAGVVTRRRRRAPTL
jgi:LPXTG-motif cell wall-anchored protein